MRKTDKQMKCYGFASGKMGVNFLGESTPSLFLVECWLALAMGRRFIFAVSAKADKFNCCESLGKRIHFLYNNLI